MPLKRKLRVAGASADAGPAASTAPSTSVVAPTIENVQATVYRLARVVAPTPRTSQMSTPQSIQTFAEDAKTCLAALNDALTTKAAVALLQRGTDLAWKEAVIPSADVAVERAMLEAPGVSSNASTNARAEGPADAQQAQADLPAPTDTTGKEKKDRGKRKAPLAAIAVPAAKTKEVHNPLSVASASALDSAGALALAESKAPLRCLRERDAVAKQGLASRKHRRRYKNADDVFEVVVDGEQEPTTEVHTNSRGGSSKKPSKTPQKNGSTSKTSPNATAKEGKLDPGVDTLISVGVHNPAKPAMVLEEFLCLGTNSLYELKDKIMCAADKQAVEAGLPACERRGVFFIEGRFHEDDRDALGTTSHKRDETNYSYDYVDGGRKNKKQKGKEKTSHLNANASKLSSYATPIIEYHASLTATLGAGAHRRVCTPGDCSFVAEQALAAMEASIATAIGDGVSSHRASVAGDAAFRNAASSARKRPPQAYELGSSAEHTKLGDLQVVRGKPYLFRHRGDCDHVLTFRTVRVAHEDDLKNKNLYPLKTFTARRFRRKCSMCDVFEACFITRNDSLAPCSPCFFCESCFEVLHKNSNGTDAYQTYEKYAYHHE